MPGPGLADPRGCRIVGGIEQDRIGVGRHDYRSPTGLQDTVELGESEAKVGHIFIDLRRDGAVEMRVGPGQGGGVAGYDLDIAQIPAAMPRDCGSDAGDIAADECRYRSGDP